ncbi:MAG: hypothetical protein WC901_07415 [Candidatus Margulisiibacteriota bacterium]
MPVNLPRTVALSELRIASQRWRPTPGKSVCVRPWDMRRELPGRLLEIVGGVDLGIFPMAGRDWEHLEQLHVKVTPRVTEDERLLDNVARVFACSQVWSMYADAIGRMREGRSNAAIQIGRDHFVLKYGEKTVLDQQFWFLSMCAGNEELAVVSERWYVPRDNPLQGLVETLGRHGGWKKAK